MQHVYSAAPETPQHYSLLGLMYGQQYLPEIELNEIEKLQQEVLVGHIEDFCDCV